MKRSSCTHDKIKYEKIIESIHRVSMAYVDNNREIINNIESFSQRLSDKLRPLYDSVKNHVNELLIPNGMDPFESDANFMTFSDFDYDEPKWTQWIANCLKDGNVSQLFWKSICTSAQREWSMTDKLNLKDEDLGSNNHLMTQDDWKRAARISKIEVYPEFKTLKYGRPDIVISADKYFIIIENKIDSEEHHSQLRRYKELALKNLRKPLSKAGLIFFTNDGYGSEAIESGYVHVTYRNFAQCLRSGYGECCLNQKPDIKYWPILSTLVSIERDLLGLRSIGECHGNESLIPLLSINNYLTEAEDIHNEEEK